MTLRFTKMHGAGNDFVVIDDWRRAAPWQDARLMAAIASRRSGIGCEGLLLLQPPEAGSEADFRMRYLNPDGGEAGMCGNGARCAALFAYRQGLAGRLQRIAAGTALVEAEILCPDPCAGEVLLRTRVCATIRRQDVATPAGTLTCHCLDTGVPHAVIWTDDLGAIDVRTLGRAVRRDAAFAPAGTNVDFAARGADGELCVRTYERGVEDESGACGTGALAVALVALRDTPLAAPLTLRVSSGDRLIVNLEATEGDQAVLTLTGPARETFTGVVDLAAFGGT